MALPQDGPPPLALFSLEALNPRAAAVIADPSNSHLVSQYTTPEQRTFTVLNIGHVRSGLGGSATLATLGRTGDIHVQGTEIAKTRCSFEIDRKTKVVMFHDRSTSQSSQVFGEQTVPFEHGRIRTVVVNEKLNTIIGMGGVGRDLVKFRLCWHFDTVALPGKLAEREISRLQENPHLARTVIGEDMVALAGMETRLHESGPRQRKIIWQSLRTLGVGRFGDVYAATNLFSGRRMAVKVLRVMAEPTNPAGPLPGQLRALLKREVEILSKMKHKHIVDYIASQGWEEQKPEIFMGLKDGTFRSLVIGEPIGTYNHAGRMSHDMLQALDYLATHKIIHRDLKPDNILYKLDDGRYEFQLADFGLSSHQDQTVVARNAGSTFYMAPEVQSGAGKQTPKADVWSLFVTVLWALDVGGLRQLEETNTNYEEIKNAILSAAKLAVCARFREMARPDPAGRPSAAQMLVELYNGDGLTTQRNKVPDLA